MCLFDAPGFVLRVAVQLCKASIVTPNFHMHTIASHHIHKGADASFREQIVGYDLARVVSLSFYSMFPKSFLVLSTSFIIVNIPLSFASRKSKIWRRVASE